MRAGERDHVVGGEALAPEVLDELFDVVCRGGDVVVEHLVGVGDAAVAAPRGDLVVDAAGEVGAVCWVNPAVLFGLDIVEAGGK